MVYRHTVFVLLLQPVPHAVNTVESGYEVHIAIKHTICTKISLTGAVIDLIKQRNGGWYEKFNVESREVERYLPRISRTRWKLVRQAYHICCRLLISSLSAGFSVTFDDFNCVSQISSLPTRSPSSSGVDISLSLCVSWHISCMICSTTFLNIHS